jgi:hypothetical protein
MVSRLRVQPGKEARVQAALGELLEAAAALDPPSWVYAVQRSEHDPGLFLVYDQHEEATLHSNSEEDGRLLRLGAALRESLLEPLAVERYSVVRMLAEPSAASLCETCAVLVAFRWPETDCPDCRRTSSAASSR